MSEPELIQLALDDEFVFECGPQVSCFNKCCRDLNQALTPYDVLRLNKNLNISSKEFFQHHAVLYPGPATGLPVTSLRFSTGKEKNCPFVSAAGCRVYADRPSSCRLYPLVRAIQRSRIDGSIREYYALLQESHCQGFDQNKRQTVQQWIAGQGLAEYLRMNDALMELIALKNQLRPGMLSSEHQHWVQMAFYDLDALKEKAANGDLFAMAYDHLTALPDQDDNEAWLMWSFAWIGQAVFGKELTFQ